MGRWRRQQRRRRERRGQQQREGEGGRRPWAVVGAAETDSSLLAWMRTLAEETRCGSTPPQPAHSSAGTRSQAAILRRFCRITRPVAASSPSCLACSLETDLVSLLSAEYFCSPHSQSMFCLPAFFALAFLPSTVWSLRCYLPISFYGKTRRCGHVTDAKLPKVISGRMLTKRNIRSDGISHPSDDAPTRPPYA